MINNSPRKQPFVQKLIDVSALQKVVCGKQNN